MTFRCEPMTMQAAEAIAQWHYDGIYQFYDMDADPEDRESLLTPANWPETYYAVFDEHDELVGFYVFQPEEETVMFGLGLRPDLTGKGLGQAFAQAGLDFARQHFRLTQFRLAVATFNQRAIRLYEKLGFRAEKTFMQATNGGEYEFLQMIKRDAF